MEKRRDLVEYLILGPFVVFCCIVFYMPNKINLFICVTLELYRVLWYLQFTSC